MAGCESGITGASISATQTIAATSLTTATQMPPALQSAPPATIPTVPATLSPGLILYASAGGLWQMDGEGMSRGIIVDEGASTSVTGPLWSPEGQYFAYLRGYSQGNGTWLESLFVANRAGDKQQQLCPPAECVWYWWQGEGNLGYATGTGARCRRGDPNPGELNYFIYDVGTGKRGQLDFIPDIDTYVEFLYSPRSDKVALVEREDRSLVVLDLVTGKEIVDGAFEVESRGETGLGTWSPDGHQLAFSYCYVQEQLFCDLYTIREDGHELRRLTDLQSHYSGWGSVATAGSVVWSPDGQWLAFLAGVEGESLRYLGVMSAEGGQVTYPGIAWRGGLRPVWSPDSTRIAFVSNVQFENGLFGDPYTDLGQWDIYTIDIYTKEIERLTNDEAMEMHIDWK